MSDAKDGFQAVVDGYFAVWNEVDDAKRRALIATFWAEEGTYIDPMGNVRGREAINGFVGAVQEQFAGVRFQQVGPLDSHHDRVRFRWEAGSGDAPALAGGLDIARVADGKLLAVTGFVDFAPAADPKGGEL